MSGLIGKLSFDHDETLARPVLDQMLDAVRHRGSGPRGIHLAPGIALGCWADHHPPAWGPVVAANEDDTIRVAADAVLTNAHELRSRLERHGHVFAGRSHSELIAHAYEEWGEHAVEWFRGPFACAVWDARARRLMLARDHVGIRPLFFALLHGHGVVFASEIRALLHDPGVGREYCPAAVDTYLTLGYVPAPMTMYRRVSKVEPAQRVTVEGRRFHVEHYWDLPVSRPVARRDELTPELDHRLRAAIRLEVSDSRVNGTLFSGGAASSALLPDATAFAPTTVIAAFDQQTADVARAHAAAAHLGAEPRVEVATPDVTLIAPELAAQFDEPIADPAAVAQYAICEAARVHADEALTGHGAAALWSGCLRAGLWDEDQRRGLYTRGFAWRVREVDPLARHHELHAQRESSDPVERALYAEARTYLPDNVLVVAERAALAAGMRLRFPYLDRGLVELAASIPSAVKHARGEGMRPVRDLLSTRLPSALMPPPSLRTRRHPWLRGALAALVPRVLLAQRFDGRGIVARPALFQLWEEHCASRRDHSYRLWSVLMLEFWFREFIDGDAAEEPLEYALLKAA